MWLNAIGQLVEISGALLVAYALLVTRPADVVRDHTMVGPAGPEFRAYARRAWDTADALSGVVLIVGGFALQFAGTVGADASWWLAAVLAIPPLGVAMAVRMMLPWRLFRNWLIEATAGAWTRGGFNANQLSEMVLSIGKIPMRRGGTVPIIDSSDTEHARAVCRQNWGDDFWARAEQRAERR